MRELPIDAKVTCRDGEVGRVTDIVVDPRARAVTHIVVGEDDGFGREALVPLACVVESSRERVHLSCSRAELSSFPEFTTTHFVPASSPEAQPVIAAWQMDMWTYSYGYEPIYSPPAFAPDEPIPIVEDVVPSGELALKRGARVVSSDDEDVGEVAALVIRPDDGAVSHFVLKMGDRELTLPVTIVVRASGDGLVHLTLPRAQLDGLPAVPAGRYSASDDRPDAQHLVSIVFDAIDLADVALHTAQSVDRNLVAAVVRRDAAGALSSHEVGPAGNRVVGALRSVVERVTDRGVPDRYVRDLGRALRPDSSALVLVVQQHMEARVLEALAPLGGRILRLELSDESIARLSHQP